MPINVGAPGVNRTPGQLIRNQLLYPLSYGGKRQELSRNVGSAKRKTADHSITPQNIVAEISENGAGFKRE